MLQIYKSLLINTHISHKNLKKCEDANNDNYNECNVEYLFSMDGHNDSEISNKVAQDSYNLILTSSYMIVVPRSKKAFDIYTKSDHNDNNNEKSYIYIRNVNQDSDKIDIRTVHDHHDENMIEINSFGFLGMFLLKHYHQFNYLKQQQQPPVQPIAQPEQKGLTLRRVMNAPKTGCKSCGG